MPKALAASLALAVLPLAACAPRAVIPDPERERVQRELVGEQRWLRSAAYAAPFWGDSTKLLLSEQPLSELELVLSTGGEVIPPPAPERILAPGTSVRVAEVEFPTGWTIARRVIMTPRYHPWVLVEVPGELRYHVVVLSQTAVSFEDVRSELDRILTKDNPSSLLAALPEEQRAKVLKKELTEGMGPRAVEMAWGLPERRRIDRPAGSEEWTWPGGKRRAFFQDERLVRWER
jgi:hypothetical protein